MKKKKIPRKKENESNRAYKRNRQETYVYLCWNKNDVTHKKTLSVREELVAKR